MYKEGEKVQLGKSIELTWRYVYNKEDEPADSSLEYYSMWGRSGLIRFNTSTSQLDPKIKDLLSAVGKEVPSDEDLRNKEKEVLDPNMVSSIALCDFIILDVFDGDLDFLRNKNSNNDSRI